MSQSVSSTLHHLMTIIRERFDSLGFVDEEAGAFATGHTPQVAPFAYLCRWYPGIHPERQRAAEEECGQRMHPSYWEFLTSTNGADLLGVSLHGVLGGFLDRSGTSVVGQPISIRYQNMVERPHYVPEGHLGIGAINGEWVSQGHLYLTAKGQVELYNARLNMIGARWDSLQDFMMDEIPRRLTLFDDAGDEIRGTKRLPGNTENWERLAQESKRRNSGAKGLFRRLMKMGQHD
jgi:hypothetical protein